MCGRIRSVPREPAPELDECFAVILPGADVADPVARRVAEHARELYGRALEELPERGAVVCTLLAEYARSAALCAYMQAEALHRGLETGDALGLAKLAGSVGQQSARALDAAWAHARRVTSEGAGGADGAGDGFVVVPGGGGS